MQAMDIFEDDRAIELLDRLKKSKRIVLTGHKGPDGDAVGSTLALWNHFKEQGKERAVCTNQR